MGHIVTKGQPVFIEKYQYLYRVISTVYQQSNAIVECRWFADTLGARHPDHIVPGNLCQTLQNNEGRRPKK